MAGAGSGRDSAEKLAKLKEEIASIVVSEGGKIDASLIKKKYNEQTGQNFPKKRSKLTNFVKEHMSDDFEVTQEGTTTFIKSKTKRKNAKTTEEPVKNTKDASAPCPRAHHSNTKHMKMNAGPAVITHNESNRPTFINDTMQNMASSVTLPFQPLHVQPIKPVPLIHHLEYQNDFPSLNAHSLLQAAGTPTLHTPRKPYQQGEVSQSLNHLVKNTSSSKSLDVPIDDGRIKSEVDRIIGELSKEHYVEVDLVIKRLFETFKVQKAKNLGKYRKDEDIPGIRELLRKLREINAAIQAFVMVRSVSTLHELGKYLASLYPGAQDYEDLKLGPLVKHPLVYEYFKFPSNLEPPEITTLKVMKYMRQYMTKNKLWGSKVNVADFLEYLREHNSCETPYELGIKIDSVGLMIACIKRCSSAESTARREAEQKMMQEIAEEIEQLIPRIKKLLLGVNIRDGDSLVNKLLALSPVDVLQKLFEYCEDFFEGKVRKKVSEFVRVCVSDKPSRKLFQLALHLSCQELVQPVAESPELYIAKDTVADKDKEASRATTPKDNLAGKTSCPAQQELISEVKGWLVGKSPRSVDIKLLARVEDSVLNRYKGFTTFRDLGQGSFLQFLSDHKELETLISISSHAEDRALGVRKSDVIDLLQQCSIDLEKTSLHKVVRAQYKNLTGTMDATLLDALITRARGQENQHGKTSCVVVFEASLVADNIDTIQVQEPNNGTQKGTNHVGLLGYQDKNNVFTCLYQTPLLEDFIAWSEWEKVFAPMYGPLKPFLKMNSRNQSPANVDDKVYPRDLIAMETSTGSLLRITRTTSTDIFLKFAKRGDVIGTSGHLVSLVFKYGGVKKAPLALLANHMKDAFLSLNAVQVSKASEISSEFVIKFVIRCLSRLPPLMRITLGLKIFVEPLKIVFGSGQTPGLVLKYCETFEERSMIHCLGIHFGVSEWQEDFKRKLVLMESRDEEQEKAFDIIVVQEEVKTTMPENLNAQLEKESPTDVEDESGAEENTTDRGAINEHVSTDDNVNYTENGVITSTKEQECRAVVDSIRRDEFGIGIEFPPEHRQMMENQRSREGRGLHRLSSELYSKDTHFVLELVQNADDNRYSNSLSEDNPPSISFIVNVEKIEVFNNEVGFEEKNIRAICDVGKSTKGKQRYGYIGQKGIGFKSVFRITDTPEVHSNGYHIKFDAKSGPTGYILPHWCADNADKSVVFNEWTTRIVLPLKEEMKDAQKRTLIARFHDIQPSLLLFLRRLRQIKIHDEVSNTTREMFRRDCGEKLIEITHSSGTDLWFVVKKELSASSMKEDIESTEIALAFPLPTRIAAPTISLKNVAAFIQSKSLIQQPVFAFLPLRSYGFRFIIQADFDVPSSREDVDKDSAWNQWLRQEIASLFVEAFDDFKAHECFLGVSSIVQLVQFIPLEDEILDFFKPITQTIVEGITRKQCIPVLTKNPTHDLDLNLDPVSDCLEANRNSEVEIKWVFPSQVVVAEDYVIEELISDQILNLYLNKYYLHPDLRSYLHPPLRRVLGIETISCQHLIDIGQTIASKIKVKLGAPQSEVGKSFETFAKWVAKWLCGIYRCLERERDCSDEILQEIAKSDIFPLSSGECTPIFGRAIFLPLEETIKDEQGKTEASRKAAKMVYRELRSLHPVILTSLDDIGRSQVRKLLERLQVRCLTPRDLIKHHIIPALQAAQSKSVNNPDVVYSYMVYIKDQWDLDPNVVDLQGLRSCALVKTSKGFVNPSLEPVHFTIEYGNRTNLQKEFPSVPWTEIDKNYVTSLSSKEALICWEKFLSALGVVHFLAIERKDIVVSKSNLSDSVWSSLSEFWPQVTGDSNYIIKDYGSSELEILLDAGSNEELKRLAEILDHHWDDMYSKYAKDVPYLDEQGKVLGQTYSSFFLNIKEQAWLPTKSSKSSFKALRSCPRNVFMPQPDIVSLLGDHVLYAAPSLTNENFLKVLGIQTSVSFNTLVAELMKWVQQSLDSEDSGFTTSLNHMTNVYKFLGSQIQDNDEKKKFLEDVTKNKHVVFVPDNTTCPQGEDTVCKVLGTFLPTKRVYWSDPSNLMQESQKETLIVTDPRRCLKNYYSNSLRNFFVTFLGIDASPNLKEYLNLLETIVSQSTMASGLIVDNIMRVYDVIATKCLEQDATGNSTKFVKSKLLNLRVFPTMEEKWVSLAEKPLFNDDKSLSKLFRELDSQKKDDEASDVKSREETVHFVKIGLQPKHRKVKRNEAGKSLDEENARIRENVQTFFREVCDIRNLSECVSHEIISQLASECPSLQSFLFRWIPCIQRFLYWKHYERHEKHQESGIANALSNVRCFAAEYLEVVYRLSSHPKITVSIKKTCGIEINTFLAFYVTDTELKDTKHIIQELAQFFAPPSSVGDFNNFLSVLTQKSEDDVEQYMETQDLDFVPDSVTVWTVPEPPPIPVPVIVEPPDQITPPVDTVITPKPERPSEIQETDGEPRGLQCWPPKSPGTSVVHGTASKNPATEQLLTAWPPPAPPDAYVNPVVEAAAPTAQSVRPADTQPVSYPGINVDPGYEVDTQHPTQIATVPAVESCQQPAMQVVLPQPTVNFINPSVGVNDTPSHNIFSSTSRVIDDDVTRQQPPQYFRPLRDSDVKVELEEVDLGTALNETELIPLTQSAKAEDIGRWGEKCVYILLKNIEINNEVIWVNEVAETGLPYDIIIKGELMEVFIEVKSTSTERKQVEISSQEIKYAFEKQENYHLYRVYNAGNPRECRVARLCNLASNLDSKAVSLFILI